MKRLHILFSLTSFVVLLVSIERFSPTTKILLAPYNFLRLHEVIQMLLLIAATVVIPFFILKEVTNSFETIKKGKGLLLAAVFVLGIYLYATGNGIHELASFLLNTYCNVKLVSGNLCGGFFFTDYYFGNIVYFVGAFLMNVALILLEVMKPKVRLAGKDVWYIGINSVFYALAIFAYAGFDVVIVGLVYGLLMMVVADVILLFHWNRRMTLPVTFYTALTYAIGILAAIVVRAR